MRRAEIKDGKILIDGQAQQIISGAIHYFRVHPALWDDRLDKAVAFGLNTIETYIPWNLHEPHPGEYCFSGLADLESFIEKVQNHGLYLILRPGPYICAEWDNGGFPGWLMAIPGMQLRRMNQPYLDAVTRYYDVLLPKLEKWMYPNGGPVIMMQVENEYGSFGHDKEYLKYISDLYCKHNLNVPQFTSDGAYGHYILGGILPGAMAAMNFGSRSEEAFRNARRIRPEGPDFCMEFWNGWFDHWGEPHHKHDEAQMESVAKELESMLSSGANVNFYMFHGGTNFGFYNGANGNFGNQYNPTVTSYDYDCPLCEYGDPTPKYYKFRDVIAKCTGKKLDSVVKPVKKICPADVELKESAAVLDNLEVLAAVSGNEWTPPTMEQIGENFGFIHYSTRLDGPFLPVSVCGYQECLRLIEVNDFAQVWLDGTYLGNRWRDEGMNEFKLPEIPPEGARLDILVENCGRINYGPQVGRDFKGILNGVALEMQYRFGWDYNMLPMSELSGLKYNAFADQPAVFHRG